MSIVTALKSLAVAAALAVGTFLVLPTHVVRHHVRPADTGDEHAHRLRHRAGRELYKNVSPVLVYR